MYLLIMFLLFPENRTSFPLFLSDKMLFKNVTLKISNFISVRLPKQIPIWCNVNFESVFFVFIFQFRVCFLCFYISISSLFSLFLYFNFESVFFVFIFQFRVCFLCFYISISSLFSLFFFILFIAIQTDSKLTLHHVGKFSLRVRLTEIKSEIWRVTFSKSCLPLRNYGMGFRFSGNNENMMDRYI